MNTTLPFGNTSGTPSSNGGSHLPVPDTSMLPGTEDARPAAVGLLKQAVQGAHDTIDHLADVATPAVQKLGLDMTAAAEAVHVRTDQLRHTRDEWAEDARATVRRHPLASVATALVLGAVLFRLVRIAR